jgi:hypothetical protein
VTAAVRRLEAECAGLLAYCFIVFRLGPDDLVPDDGIGLAPWDEPAEDRARRSPRTEAKPSWPRPKRRTWAA